MTSSWVWRLFSLVHCTLEVLRPRTSQRGEDGGFLLLPSLPFHRLGHKELSPRGPRVPEKGLWCGFCVGQGCSRKVFPCETCETPECSLSHGCIPHKVIGVRSPRRTSVYFCICPTLPRGVASEQKMGPQKTPRQEIEFLPQHIWSLLPKA